jgi:hypothetical protein
VEAYRQVLSHSSSEHSEHPPPSLQALHDSREFEAWQQATLQLDEAARQREVERRRAEMAASHEAGIAARENKVRPGV